MQHGEPMLFGLGVLGILAHCLIEVMKLKRVGKFYSYGQYLKTEIDSIALSCVILIIAIVCKQEIKSLEAAGNYLGIGFVTIGYAGQSIFIALMGKIQKNIKGDNENESGVN